MAKFDSVYQLRVSELAPEGTGYRAKTRFAKFYNLPELMSMFRMVADIQTADMLNLPVPKVNYHNIAVKPSDFQVEIVKELAERAEAVRKGDIDPHIDNMLKITNDGRKLALDQRLISPMLPDSPESKVAVCAGNVFELWEKHRDRRQAQPVFCDLSTPHYDDTFNVYDDIKEKLIDKGVPAEEIAFIHDANTEVKKATLFAKVRSGQARVLLGSTQKMGAGTNVQDRLIATHDIDCPWRPLDLEQRKGRIERQGNPNAEVEVFRYVTENTFDAYIYQLVEGKQRFISQIMTSKSPVRVADDIDETALSYAEIKALATGNPFIKEKMDLDVEVARLKMLKANHLSQRYTLEDQLIKRFPQKIRQAEEEIAGCTADIEVVKANTPAEKDAFPPMKIGETVYTDKKEAGKALIEACQKMESPAPVIIGSYRGFQMELSFNAFGKKYRVALIGKLRHSVSLGTDIHGNITRLDNKLAGLPLDLNVSTEELDNLRTQMENARTEVERPSVTSKTAAEMAEQYGFNDEQKAQLEELLRPEYDSLWRAVLYGSLSGSTDIVEVAISQIGNVGGEPYWSWYGFDSRVEWCACFVSWCANECGYIEAGIIPRFAGCQSQGIPWFNAVDLWQDSGSGYIPNPGDIIFFDWEGDGESDHVGIVEYVEDDRVHTIEGNSSDSCRRRSYSINSSVIIGYGTPAY